MTPKTDTSTVALLNWEAEVKKGEAVILSAIKRLMIRQPFIATLLLGLVRTPVSSGTMGTNGKVLIWNPAWVNKCSEYKLYFVMLHEVLHVLYKHHLRGKNLDQRLANNAMDYVINLIIVTLGGGTAKGDEGDCPSRDPYYKMPKDGLFSWDYIGMTFEEVYELLKSAPEDGEGPPPPPGDEKGPGGNADSDPCEDGDTPGDDGQEELDEEEGDTGKGADDDKAEEDEEGTGDEGDCPWGSVTQLTNEDGTDLSEEEMQKAERDLEKRIIQAENIAKARGNMPATLSEAVEAGRQESQDWQDVLREALQEKLPNDFSFDRPNRYHMSSDLIMPTTQKEGMGHVGFFVDASGSVSTPEFSQFMSDVDFIFEELTPETITMIQFDHDASEPKEYEMGDEVELVREREGGTRFTAPFSKAQALGLDADFDIVVFFTDGGDNTFPKEEPPYPVIWATTGAWWGGPPPFGECVQVKFGKGEG